MIKDKSKLSLIPEDEIELRAYPFQLILSNKWAKKKVKILRREFILRTISAIVKDRKQLVSSLKEVFNVEVNIVTLKWNLITWIYISGIDF